MADISHFFNITSPASPVQKPPEKPDFWGPASPWPAAHRSWRRAMRTTARRAMRTTARGSRGVAAATNGEKNGSGFNGKNRFASKHGGKNRQKLCLSHPEFALSKQNSGLPNQKWFLIEK